MLSVYPLHFHLVQTNQIAKKSDLSLRRNHFNFLLISYVTSYAVRVFVQCLVKHKTANIQSISGKSNKNQQCGYRNGSIKFLRFRYDINTILGKYRDIDIDS